MSFEITSTTDKTKLSQRALAKCAHKKLKQLCKRQTKKAELSTQLSQRKKQPKKARKALALSLYQRALPILEADLALIMLDAKAKPKKRDKLIKKRIKTQLKALSRNHISANDVIDNKQTLSTSTNIIATIRPQTSARSFALRPLKKSPCGGCPALKGKLCKCALKYQQSAKAG